MILKIYSLLAALNVLICIYSTPLGLLYLCEECQLCKSKKLLHRKQTNIVIIESGMEISSQNVRPMELNTDIQN